MSTHLSDEELAQLRVRSSAALALRTADEHLAGCAECRARAASMSDSSVAAERLLTALHDDGDAIHLEYERLEAIVDGRASASDRMAAQRHLVGCARCAAELDSLRALAIDMTERAHTRTTGPRNAVVGTITPATTTLVTDISVARRARRRRAPRRLITSLTALIVAGVLLSAVLILSRLPSHDAAPRAADVTVVPAALSDGGLRITIDGAGVVRGTESLSPRFADVIARALRSAAGLETITRAAPIRQSITDSAGVSYPNAHLLLGALYERDGRSADAAREYALVAAENPGEPLARRLLDRAREAATRR